MSVIFNTTKYKKSLSYPIGIIFFIAIVFSFLLFSAPYSILPLLITILILLVLLFLSTNPKYIFLAGVLALSLTRIGTLRLGFFTISPSQFLGILLFYFLIIILSQKNGLKTYINVPFSSIIFLFILINLLSIIQSRLIPSDYTLIPQIMVSARNKPFIKSLTQIVWMLVGIIWYFNTFYLIKTRASLYKTLKVFLLCSAITGAFGIYQFIGYYMDLPYATDSLYLPGLTNMRYISHVGQFIRVSSFYLEPSPLAIFLICSLPLAFVTLLFKNNLINSKLGKILFFIPISLCFILTLSRVTLILSVFLTFAFYLVKRIYNLPFKRNTFFKTIIVVAICAITIEIGLRTMTSLGLIDILKEQFQSLFVPTEESYSNLQRLGSWITAFNMFLKHPILGVGVGNFLFHMQNNAPSWLIITDQTAVVMNIYLETLAETGILGFAIFMFFIYSIIKAVHVKLKLGSINPNDRILLIGLLIGFVGLLIGHCFTSDFYFPFVWVYLGIINSFLNVIDLEHASPEV